MVMLSSSTSSFPIHRRPAEPGRLTCRDCCPGRCVPEMDTNRWINHATVAYHPQLRDGAISGPRGGINEIIGRSILEEGALGAHAGARGKIGAPRTGAPRTGAPGTPGAYATDRSRGCAEFSGTAP